MDNSEFGNERFVWSRPRRLALASNVDDTDADACAGATQTQIMPDADAHAEAYQPVSGRTKTQETLVLPAWLLADFTGSICQRNFVGK